MKIQFFYTTQAFGFRGSNESKQLRWGNVKQKHNGKDYYLEFNERLSETHTGSGNGGARPFNPKLFETEGDRCPLKFYQEFSRKWPAEMCHDDSPFY